MTEQKGATRTRSRVMLSGPKMYLVFIYNDDFTTMEFVVAVLMKVFGKSQADAERLMLMVHRSERAAVGVYALDVAQSKVRVAMNWARMEGFPLRLECEPVEE